MSKGNEDEIRYRIAASWAALGQGGQLPVTRSAVQFAHTNFFAKLTDFERVDDDKFERLLRIFEHAGAHAASLARDRGEDAIDEHLLLEAAQRIARIMADRYPAFRSICEELRLC